MVGVERIRHELVCRDDRVARPRQVEPVRHRFQAMAALGRARRATRCPSDFEASAVRVVPRGLSARFAMPRV
jgi:hypothetical protein